MGILIGFLIGTVCCQSLILGTFADASSSASAFASASASSSSCSSPSPSSSSAECACHKIFSPVCGSNGVTYSNKCVLECVSDDNVENGLPPIKVAYPGECKKLDCICPAVVDPVCGTNGQTYSNVCELNCVNKRLVQEGKPIINIAYLGECTTAPPCNDIIVPVCGTDGRTYRNICYLQYESQQNQLDGLPPIYFKSSGPCRRDTCVCPLNVDPVCASDGKTYSNKCLFNCENRRREELGQKSLTIVHKGECKVDCICTAEYAPVCGSDGNTYGNRCAFNCENKNRIRQGLPPLTILNDGECESCFCPLYVDPVCVSDGNVYSNKCFLACENKKLKSQGKPSMKVVNDSYCVSCACTKEYNPVCGSDDVTYGNPCLFKCENLRRQSLGLPLLSIRYQGECNNRCKCAEIYDPVCATDNRYQWTYNNKCELDCENWRRAVYGYPPLTILNKGPCVDPCRCNCSYQNAPVCGNDGRTYRNICWLECTSRCYQSQGYPGVGFIKNGYC